MNLADRCAERLAKDLGYDNERRAVIAYGLGALFQLVELFCIALIFGLMFDCLIETMIVFWGVGLMRRTTGGKHCRTYIACILTSSLSVCLIALICRYLIPGWFPTWIYYIAFLMPAAVCFAVIAYKCVPQASENKPIDNPKKIARLRRECLFTYLVYLALAIVLPMLKWDGGRNISAFMALVAVFWWQAFTLTAVAARLAHFMDRLFIDRNC